MRLVGVGVGPGDPELLTARAQRVLRQASQVFAPSVALDAVGRAEAVVRQACPEVVVRRLAFDMGSADGSVETAAGELASALDSVAADGSGAVVAFVTLGDPNVYSTFTDIAAAVRRRCPDVEVETVPGITAFQDLASRAGVVLLQGREHLRLVTALDGPEALAEALDDPAAAVVVYKGGRHLPEVAKRLADAGRLDGAVFGELMGLPGERVAPLSEVAAGPAAYLATVVVPPAGRARR